MVQLLSGKARDFDITVDDLRSLVNDAQSQATSEGAQDFAAKMVIAYKQYGMEMFLSRRQADYLCSLAEWEPLRLAR
jgi:hypothetical protein